MDALPEVPSPSQQQPGQSLSAPGEIDRSTQLSCGEHTDYGVALFSPTFCAATLAHCRFVKVGVRADTVRVHGRAGLLTLVNQDQGITALQVSYLCRDTHVHVESQSASYPSIAHEWEVAFILGNAPDQTRYQRCFYPELQNL